MFYIIPDTLLKVLLNTNKTVRHIIVDIQRLTLSQFLYWILRLSGAPGFTPGISWVRVAQSLVFCVVFCKSLFVLFSRCSLWELHRLSFIDLRLLISSSVSSNDECIYMYTQNNMKTRGLKTNKRFEFCPELILLHLL